MAMNKDELLWELKHVWVETTLENPSRDVLHQELMDMLPLYTDDKTLLWELDDMIGGFYCIGEEHGFFNGVEVFRELMKD